VEDSGTAYHSIVVYKNHLLSVLQLEEIGGFNSRDHDFHARLITFLCKTNKNSTKYDKFNTHIHSLPLRNPIERESKRAVVV
jgi:hypothetical protein